MWSINTEVWCSAIPNVCDEIEKSPKRRLEALAGDCFLSGVTYGDERLWRGRLDRVELLKMALGWWWLSGHLGFVQRR